MNRQKSIALFAVIAAIAMTTIGLTGVSSTSLVVSPLLPESEDVQMLGHIEYILLDSQKNVKQYVQGDNAVANEGKDCVGSLVFGANDDGNCIDTSSKFTFIAVGNDTTGGVIPDTGAGSDIVMLTNSSATNGCATASEDGELGRIDADVTYSSISDNVNSVGSKVEIETTTAFVIGGNNATTIFQSALYNAPATSYTAGDCTTITKAAQNMFSIQELNQAGGGIAVTEGDSLSVKWTITIG